MKKLKEKLKGTFIHKIHIWLCRIKKMIIGSICNKSFYMKKKYISKKFNKRLGYKMDWENPKTYNQKIQFRKVFDKNQLYALCSDKYRVREYVKEKIGEQYLIPLHLVTDKLTEEQWEKLPNQCVIKANHNSGPVQIILDKTKADKYKVIKEINRQLKEKYGLISMESYYDDIKPMIIVEKILGEKGKIPSDYKFHCFNNGRNIFIQIDSSRYQAHRQDFFDHNWNKIDLEVLSINSNSQIKKPKNLEQLKKIAKKLSKDFDYVRVDLYNVKEKIYFGELTFCPWSGLTKFKQFKWDQKWGELWDQKIVK